MQKLNAAGYRTNRHSCFLLEYHLVIVTKYRHPVITGCLRERLIGLTYTVLEKEWGCDVSAVNTDMDHIHVMFEVPGPQVQMSKLVNNYKTVTSRLLRKEFSAEFAPYYWKPYFWSDSYFICTVSDRSHAAVLNYIQRQGR